MSRRHLDGSCVKKSRRHNEDAPCVHTDAYMSDFEFNLSSKKREVPAGECYICLAELSDAPSVIFEPCKHVLHRHCYDALVRINPRPTCPQCRMLIKNAWNLADQNLSFYQTAFHNRNSIYHNVLRHNLELKVGNDNEFDQYITNFMANLCRNEEITFAGIRHPPDAVYAERYHRLFDRVYAELQSWNFNDNVSWSYTDEIIEHVRSQQKNEKNNKALELFDTKSDQYEKYLHDISDGYIWPYELIWHSQYFSKYGFIPNLNDGKNINKKRISECIKGMISLFRYDANDFKMISPSHALKRPIDPLIIHPSHVLKRPRS